jgi:hypothetical protein
MYLSIKRSIDKKVYNGAEGMSISNFTYIGVNLAGWKTPHRVAVVHVNRQAAAGR